MLATVAFFILILLIIPIQHLAFGRESSAIRRELFRRAIGIGTVMLLALLPVLLGELDIVTWAVIFGGFLLAGVILAGMVWFEERRERAARVEQARRTLHEQIEQWARHDGPEADF